MTLKRGREQNFGKIEVVDRESLKVKVKEERTGTG